MTIDEVERHLLVISDDVLGNDMVDLYEAQNCCDTSFSIGYNKAIDDFANVLKENYDYLPQILSQEAFGLYIDEYAEQLKEGDGE